MANIKLISPVVKAVKINPEKIIKISEPLIDKGGKYIKKVLNDNKGKIGTFVVAEGYKAYNRYIRKKNKDGSDIFIYDLKKLSELKRRHIISSEVFEYLSNEVLVYEDILNKNNRNFEKLFKDIIKCKDRNKVIFKKKQYELIRDAWIKKENNNCNKNTVNEDTGNAKNDNVDVNKDN